MTLPPATHFLNPHFPGFIQHAEGIPFYLKPQKTPGHPPGTSQHYGQGIMLHHPYAYKPGTWLQLTLDVKHIGIKHPEHESNDYVNFDCRVVLVQSLQKNYRLALCPATTEQQKKLRMLEQYCHITVYQQLMKYQNGPYENPERLARDWVEHFAASFPGMPKLHALLDNSHHQYHSAHGGNNEK